MIDLTVFGSGRTGQLAALDEITTAADTDVVLFESAAGVLQYMTVANAKTLFAGGGGGGAVTPDPTDSDQWILEAVQDYSGYQDSFTTYIGPGWISNTSGGSTSRPAGVQGVISPLVLSTGAGASNYIAHASQGTMVFGGGKRDWRMHFRFKTDTVPTAGVDYRYRLGFADDLRHGGSIYNGIYLAMERAEDTTEFSAVCIDALTKTSTATGQAFASDTVYNGYIEINADADSVDMEVRPEETAFSSPTNISTNIPDNTVSAMFRGIENSKVAGSGDRQLIFDSYQLFSRAAA